jgi:hypothetical protein
VHANPSGIPLAIIADLLDSVKGKKGFFKSLAYKDALNFENIRRKSHPPLPMSHFARRSTTGASFITPRFVAPKMQ